MNDYEKLKKTFDDIEVEYEELNVKEEFGECPARVAYDGEVAFDQLIRLGNGAGYFDFQCDHYFLEGKYQGHGVWEC